MQQRIAAVLLALTLAGSLAGCLFDSPSSDRGPGEDIRSGGPAGGSNSAGGGRRWPTFGLSRSDKRQELGGVPREGNPLYPQLPVYGRDHNPFVSGGGALDGDWKYGERMPDMDPANPVQKEQMGVEYQPRAWVENLYNPNTLGTRLSRAGLLNGLTQNTFAEAGGDHNVTLNPSGRTMFYSTTRMSKNPKLAMQDVDGKAWTLLTDDSMADMMPAVSPDGEWLAWCSNRYGNWSLLMRQLDAPSGSSPKQLTRTPDDDIHPSWSHDSQFLAFSRFNSMDGNWQIWV
ncbi:MAG: hypothetical protein LBU79_01935, partial [Planctomycetota bacterium]|nr:hypothetical protein [Planctomycetota bacterium]